MSKLNGVSHYATDQKAINIKLNMVINLLKLITNLS